MALFSNDLLLYVIVDILAYGTFFSFLVQFHNGFNWQSLDELQQRLMYIAMG